MLPLDIAGGGIDRNRLAPAFFRSEARAAAALEGLVVTDIGIYPELDPALTERVYDEIAVAMLDFICARPDARSVLNGRTFVRNLH